MFFSYSFSQNKVLLKAVWQRITTGNICLVKTVKLIIQKLGYFCHWLQQSQDFGPWSNFAVFHQAKFTSTKYAQKCSHMGRQQDCEYTENKTEKRVNFFNREHSHSDEQLVPNVTPFNDLLVIFRCISGNTALSFATYYPFLIQKHILLLYCYICFSLWNEQHQLPCFFLDFHFCDQFIHC